MMRQSPGRPSRRSFFRSAAPHSDCSLVPANLNQPTACSSLRSLLTAAIIIPLTSNSSVDASNFTEFRARLLAPRRFDYSLFRVFLRSRLTSIPSRSIKREYRSPSRMNFVFEHQTNSAGVEASGIEISPRFPRLSERFQIHSIPRKRPNIPERPWAKLAPELPSGCDTRPVKLEVFTIDPSEVSPISSAARSQLKFYRRAAAAVGSRPARDHNGDLMQPFEKRITWRALARAG